MKYAGKVYSSDIYVGTVFADSITALKRKASVLCNKYHRAVDTLVLHRANDKEDVNLKFSRINRLSPDNRVVRGSWS